MKHLKTFESYENLEKIDEGWKDWLMGILIGASTLFSNPASAQKMTDEEIKTEIVDSWEEFKKKAQEKQKDTTDNYLWSIYKDTVATYLSKCPTGCDEDTLYRIEDVITRMKIDKKGSMFGGPKVTDADEWRFGTVKTSGEEPSKYYKTHGKYRDAWNWQKSPEGEDIKFTKIKSKTDTWERGTHNSMRGDDGKLLGDEGWESEWEKEKYKKGDSTSKHSSKEPGQKIDRWEERIK